MAGHAPAGFRSGGMVTKLMAAEIAKAAGCRRVIAAGGVLYPRMRIKAGDRATGFALVQQDEHNQDTELTMGPSTLAAGY